MSFIFWVKTISIFFYSRSKPMELKIRNFFTSQQGNQATFIKQANKAINPTRQSSHF
jgi:hypothetical protein